MADTFPGQHDDESIDFVFRQHPVVMRRSMLYSMLALAVGLIPSMIWPLESWVWWVVLAGFLLGLIIFGYRFISWYFSIYIITNERLIEIRQHGLFKRSVNDISHNRIQSVNYDIIGIQAMLLKFGTVSVQTYAGPVITMEYIHRPEEVQQHLNKIIRKIRPPDSEEGEEEIDEEE